MRVHHLINDIGLKNGGAQRLVRQLHQDLRKSGIDSRLVALCQSTDDSPMTTGFGNRSPYSLKTFFDVCRYIHFNCASSDIIHTHLFPTNFYVALASRFLGWKGTLVCTEHSTYNRRREKLFGKQIDQLIYSTYQCIYCISRGTYDALEQWVPLQAKKLKVVENGVRLPYSSFHPKAGGNKLIIVSAGRLHKLKNYETAIAAMSQLKDIDFEYWIAGTGPELSNLEQLCEQLNVRHKIKFLGYIEDIFSLFSEADIFLIPSFWEGFGLAAVEAMNSGLPVIASNVAGLKEIIDTSPHCGVLISPDNPAEITDAIHFFENVEHRSEFGKHAFERSLEFSLEHMIQKYIEEYQQIISQTIQ